MKNKLILLAFSVSIFLVWALCFLDIKADRITAGLGFIYTMCGFYFLQKRLNLSIQIIDIILVLSAPVFYLIIYTIIRGSISYVYFINPFLIGLALLLSVITIFKDLSKPSNVFILLFFISMYTYRFYPEWKIHLTLSMRENFDATPKEKKEKESTVLLDSINLFDYKFIDINLDTASLLASNKFTLIETWNETCAPCIRAFKELPDFYKANEDRLSVHYLYEHDKEAVRKKFDKIFNFKQIGDKSKILIDINQQLYNGMEMDGYPYFVLFDENGKHVFTQKGYLSSRKAELEKNILDIIR